MPGRLACPVDYGQPDQRGSGGASGHILWYSITASSRHPDRQIRSHMGFVQGCRSSPGCGHHPHRHDRESGQMRQTTTAGVRRERHTPWQVKRLPGSEPRMPSQRRTQRAGAVQARINPSWRTGDRVRWEGSLARLAVTLRTAPMPRSASATASIGYGSPISDRGDGFFCVICCPPGFSRQPIVAKRGVSVSM
jgi:hypothetical protein